MRAVVHDRYGPVDQVLRVQDVDIPAIADDDVLVRVRAASVHPDVWHVVTGRPYVLRLMGNGASKPNRKIPGTDLAGVVESVGSNVTRFNVGDSVFGATVMMAWQNGGTFAEYAVAPQDCLLLKPANVTFEQASTVPSSGLIAVPNVRVAKVTAGQRVLINGAGGCVGRIAVQLAKAQGARVTGVDRPEKLDMIRALGADEVIDFTRDDFIRGGTRYDFILDVASTRSLRECKRVLTATGVYWLIGHDHFGRAHGRILGSMPRFFGLMARLPFDDHLPTFKFKMPSPQDHVSVLQALRDCLESGTLTPIVARTFSLGEVPAAFQCLQEGRAPGGLVITP